MAPFDGRYSPDLINKVSTQIDGQLPDFVADDHPIFSTFLQSYYKYLESGELVVSATIDNVLLELETTTRLLDEEDNRIVLETGTGTTGKFIVGETITGATSGATAEVLVDDLGNTTKPRLFITSQQQFITGETITGGTSSATGTVTSYRASPVQNIQQLLAYADVDNTIFDFLEEFRKSFMNAIPSSLATGLDKRNLTKNIRELYRRKGTQEGLKLFIRILLDQESEIFYPNTRMIRASGGDWDKPTIIRVSPIGSPVHAELAGQTITGQSSGATARIESATTFVDPSDASTIVEFSVTSIVGTFTKDEIIQGVSSVEDVLYTYNIRQIVTSSTVTNDGILYSVADVVDVDTSTNIGSGDVTAVVGNVSRGSVSGVVVDDGGTNYEIGDVLTFTDNSNEAGLVSSAVARVQIVHGSVIMEDGDTLLQENNTITEIEFFRLVQEDGEDLFFESGNAASYTDGINTEAVLGDRVSCEAAVQEIRIDTTKRDSDGFVLESGSGDITKVFLQDGGKGYSLLPTVTVTSKFGTGTKLLTTTNDIGRVEDVDISVNGFDYTESPLGEFRANFVVKDVTGSFTVDAALTSHEGTVRSFDSGTQVLEVSIEDKVRIDSEGNTAEGIRLEESLVNPEFVGSSVILDNDIVYGENLIFEDGDNAVLDAFDAVTDFILLEDDQGELIMEFAEVRASQILLEEGDGTFGGIGAAGSILTEDGDYVVLEDEETELPFSYGTRHVKFVQESSDPNIKFGVGDNIVVDDLVSGDSLVTNEDKLVLLNGIDSSGTDDGGENVIVLDGTDANGTDAGDRLQQDIEDFDEIVLDGTDSSSLHQNENVILEETIDFSNTTISTSAGSATIVNADIAKGTLDLGLSADRFGRYPGIESLIGEDLIRIQDSYYYQQFSYEVQTASGASSYIEPLKKAVHPSGFEVFSKVKTSTSVYAGIATPTGASLGDEYVADTNTFSPILASTFETLFDEVNQTRHKAFGLAPEHVELETETGVGVIRTETELGGIKLSLEDGTVTGEYDKRVIRTITTVVQSNPSRVGDSANGLTFISNVIQESTLGDTLAMEFGAALGVQGTAADILLDNTADIGLADVGDRILLETSEDVNNGEGITFRDYVILRNDTVVQEDGDNLLLETGFNLKIEDEEAGPPVVSELSVADGLNIADDHSVINILDEQSDTGSIMQEDETTVATTHGDEFLLEDATALLRGGKLSVETQTIALEDDTSIGSMPTENFDGDTRVPRFARSSEIFVSQIGRLVYEDALDGGNVEIIYEANTTDLSGVNISGENIQLENGTQQSVLDGIYGDGLFQGFDATVEGFDTTAHTFDMTTPQ